MTEATQEKVQEAQSMPRQMVPCECDIYYSDLKLGKETIVTVDQPLPLPNGMLQFHQGDEMVIVNPQHIRKVRIKAIKNEEKRIIT